MAFRSPSLESIGSFRSKHEQLFDYGQQFLGIDPIILVNLGLIIAAFATFIHYTGGSMYRYAQKVCLSSIHINEDDELYQYVMRWMSDHQVPTKAFRSVKATMPQKSSWEDEEDATKTINQDFNVEKLISYRSIIGRMPIKLQPFEGSHIFRYKGSWIHFSHKVHKGSIIFDPRERGFIKLECLGRSLAPLQKLLKDMQSYTLEKSMSTTNIYRAITGVREQIRWNKVISRPSRAITTVILDKEKKQALLQDINEYLHPRTRRWYSNHGIPYRRGYLFSGAPGTGKTSLTSALAGVFGLDIYVLSLLDPALNESQLMRVLSDVPSRCIVLLEDVDAAGLKRHLGSNAKTKTSSHTPEDVITDLATNKESKQQPATGISLSGLLNAIDGVSSHEGRILIMTTNSPKDLDKALIRPGRVDMHIAFQLPSHAEMEELFLSMYAEDEATGIAIPLTAHANGHAASAVTEKIPVQASATDVASGTDELKRLSVEFAAALPEGTLSLAAIQGFLLAHKRSPKDACEKAGDWGEEMVRKIEEEKEERGD